MKFKVPGCPHRPFPGGSSVAFFFLSAVVSYLLPLPPREVGNCSVIVSFPGYLYLYCF